MHRFVFAVLFAALALGHAPAAHATWRTGKGIPPAWRADRVCVDGVDFTFAFFAPQDYPAAQPPKTLDTVVFPGSMPLSKVPPNDVLRRGRDNVPADPLVLSHDPLDWSGLENLLWRDGSTGVFDYHVTRRFTFPAGVQLPVGSDVTVAFNPVPWGWTGWGSTTDPVQHCRIASLPAM